MFREGTDFTVLDRSRGEWGEAADDVSAMTINYFLFGLLKTDGREIDNDFKLLYETFFDVYLKETSDYELSEVIQPFYAFRGLVVASPIWYPNISLWILEENCLTSYGTCLKRRSLIIKG